MSLLQKTVLIVWISLALLAISLAISYISPFAEEYWHWIEIFDLHLRLSARYLITFCLLTLLFYNIYRNRRDSVRHLVLILCFLIAAFLDGAGNAFKLYGNRFLGLYYDRYMHLIIPFVLTVGVIFFIKDRSSRYARDILLGALIVFQASVIFEVYEHYSDMYFDTRMVYGLNDTMRDVSLDYLGCLLAAAVLYFYLMRKQREEVKD